jgi:hypothetical protein
VSGSTGGTFTDFHVTGPGVDLIFKFPRRRTIRRRPCSRDSAGFASVWRPGRIGAWIARKRLAGGGDLTVVHGTTVGTNALLTRRLARGVRHDGGLRGPSRDRPPEPRRPFTI